MVRIIVVDDHALFRVGLVGILRQESEFNIVAEYRSLTSVTPIASLNLDLALVDISLEDRKNGIDLAREIKLANPHIRVVILSSHKEEYYIGNALRAGVDGYIHKGISPEELVHGLKKVLQGKKFYSMEISDLLINNMFSRTMKGLPLLTSKEKQVVEYLMEGLVSKEIADRLKISTRTVEKHRANVLGKFNLKNTTELIRKIVEDRIPI